MRAKIAVLDDYQGAALKLADWSAVTARAEVEVFKDHLSDADAVANGCFRAGNVSHGLRVARRVRTILSRHGGKHHCMAGREEVSSVMARRRRWWMRSAINGPT